MQKYLTKHVKTFGEFDDNVGNLMILDTNLLTFLPIKQHKLCLFSNSFI